MAAHKSLSQRAQRELAMHNRFCGMFKSIKDVESQYACSKAKKTHKKKKLLKKIAGHVNALKRHAKAMKKLRKAAKRLRKRPEDCSMIKKKRAPKVMKMEAAK